MKLLASLLTAGIICGCSAATGSGEDLPTALTSRIPPDYQIASFRSTDFNGDGLKDFVVIAVSKQEKDSNALSSEDAPKRLVLIYFGKRTANDVAFELVAQNDTLALPVNGGGMAAPCDPIFDSGDGLAVKGAYFTVENRVDCGAHWSDYITFMYSPTAKSMVFHNRISEVWELSDKSDGLKLAHRRIKKAGPEVLLLQDYQAF